MRRYIGQEMNARDGTTATRCGGVERSSGDSRDKTKFSKRNLLLGTLAGLATGKTVAGPAQEAATARKKPRIGIALGAGGASGLVHILMLEVLDEFGIRPHRMAGSSIGAVVGALYASGLNAGEIRKLVERFLVRNDARRFDRWFKVGPLRLVDFVKIDPRKGGLLSSAGFLSLVSDTIKFRNIEDLPIPIAIIAADLWKREPVVLKSGSLIDAIGASMALPGVFKPVSIDGRVLVDGGTVNPVPYDIVAPECDIVIAVDVIGRRSRPNKKSQNYFETIFQSAKVMQAAIMSEKRKVSEPTIYMAPPVNDVRSLQFHRAEHILEQAEQSKEVLRGKLQDALEEYARKQA